jgi:hypothetical protein
LAADGTLSKGSAQAESKTLQSFLDLIPVKDTVSAVAKAGLAGAALSLATPGLEVDHFKFDLATDTKVFKHTHSQNDTDTKDCKAARGYVTTDFSLTIAEVTASGTSDQTKPKTDQNQLKLQGTIDLPKTAPTPTQAVPSAKP